MVAPAALAARQPWAAPCMPVAAALRVPLVAASSVAPVRPELPGRWVRWVRPDGAEPPAAASSAAPSPATAPAAERTASAARPSAPQERPAAAPCVARRRVPAREPAAARPGAVAAAAEGAAAEEAPQRRQVPRSPVSGVRSPAARPRSGTPCGTPSSARARRPPAPWRDRSGRSSGTSDRLRSSDQRSSVAIGSWRRSITKTDPGRVFA